MCLNDEQECLGCAPGAPLSAATEHGGHENAKIEPGDVDQITLVNILAPAQPRAAHAAAIQDVGKAPLDHLTTLPHRLASDGGFPARPIVVDGLLGRLVSVPRPDSLRRCPPRGPRDRQRRVVGKGVYGEGTLRWIP